MSDNTEGRWINVGTERDLCVYTLYLFSIETNSFKFDNIHIR